MIINDIKNVYVGNNNNTSADIFIVKDCQEILSQ